MKDLAERAVSGFFGALIVLAWLFLAQRFHQSWAIAVLLAVVTLWTGLEYLELLRKSGDRIPPYSFLSLAVLVILAYGIADGSYGAWALFGAVAWLLVRHLPMQESLASLAGSLLGLLYIPYLLHFFYAIYFVPDGLRYSLLLLALVWGYDTGAYLTGSVWGRHRICPAFSPSPQKSWEGVAGGLLLIFVMSLISKLWIAWPASISGFLLQAGPLVLLSGLAAQLGDFFESKLKRAAGVKDAGKLFPGHGGLLDRIDGLLFVLPLFYGYLRYVLHWL